MNKRKSSSSIEEEIMAEYEKFKPILRQWQQILSNCKALAKELKELGVKDWEEELNNRYPYYAGIIKRQKTTCDETAIVFVGHGPELAVEQPMYDILDMLKNRTKVYLQRLPENRELIQMFEKWIRGKQTID